jgi:hypothetical protein
MQEPVQKEKKERPKLFEVLSILISVLIAGTTLLNFRGQLPEWWFQTSLVVLLLIVAVIVINIMIPTISSGFRQWRVKRKRNRIAQKYFSEFKSLVDECRNHDYAIRNIGLALYQNYRNYVKSPVAEYVLQRYNEGESEQLLYNINEEMKEWDKSFNNLFLITKHFELLLLGFRRNLNVIEQFAHEIMIGEKTISKGIENDYEKFREKYNYFLNRFKEYCQRVNREIEEDKFPERSFDMIAKW